MKRDSLVVEIMRRLNLISTANGYDFDLLNDEALQKLAEYSDGDIKIQNMRYKILLLPNIESIPLETLRKIEEYVKTGGTVVALDRLPEYSTGYKESKHKDEEVKKVASEIIGMTLVTRQTGPEGRLVGKVLVEQMVEIKREFYLSIVPDRATAKIVIMASQAGGMDIEEVAAETPEKIIKVPINPLQGIQGYHCREVAFGLHLPSAVIKPFVAMLKNLYRLFVDNDCSLVEINPYALINQDTLMALDAKVNFDDNALFRHKDVAEYRDLDEEDPLEVEASKFKLNYINLDGNVGNMVNGAGLAMATNMRLPLSRTGNRLSACDDFHLDESRLFAGSNSCGWAVCRAVIFR